MLALAPIFSILPDWWLTGTLPRGLGWLGVGCAVVGTAGLSRTPTQRLDLRGLFARDDALDALGSAFFLGVLAAVDRHNVLAMNVPSYLVAAYAGARRPAPGGRARPRPGAGRVAAGGPARRACSSTP